MRILGLALCFTFIAAPQTPPPAVAGVVLECDALVTNGEFSVRAADNQVFRFQFDAKTHVERDAVTIDAGRLAPGDKVSVDSDAVPGSLVRYARAVHAIAPPAPALPLTEGRFRAVRPAASTVADRTPLPTQATGNLTFSGVIAKLSGQRLLLHTRDGDRSILIRPDTHYVEDGATVAAASLQPNMRVFVRAGTDLFERVEAYQVIWGGILLAGDEQ